VVKVSDSWSEHRGFNTCCGPPRLWPWASHLTSNLGSFDPGPNVLTTQPRDLHMHVKISVIFLIWIVFVVGWLFNLPVFSHKTNESDEIHVTETPETAFFAATWSIDRRELNEAKTRRLINNIIEIFIDATISVTVKMFVPTSDIFLKISIFLCRSSVYQKCTGTNGLNLICEGTSRWGRRSL
jgi:hypothetical protein